jgi:hypothetical protein
VGTNGIAGTEANAGGKGVAELSYPMSTGVKRGQMAEEDHFCHCCEFPLMAGLPNPLSGHPGAFVAA